MAARWKTLALSTPLLLLTSVGAFAQTTVSPETSNPPAAHGIRAWISGHPVTDFFVVLAIVVVIAGSYILSKRSRA